MSQFRPCAIIPTYNNPATICEVVWRVRQYIQTVIVVDDGSDAASRRVMEELKRSSEVTVIHRSRNGGKGAAMKDGLQLAASQGFTHGLQIDADGQHAWQDIPRLLAAAKQRPEALVLAQPVFDASAPKARLYGRKLTIFWTAIEIGSRAIGDPMCGFRVYPLALTGRVSVTANRMDFDPEIAVRMVWAGAPIERLPTRVRYFSHAEGGVSHFRMVEDNLRISWMHTRLVFLAICRLFLRPFRTMRPNATEVSATTRREWHQIPESASRFGVALLTHICNVFGRSAARSLLPLIVLYYVVVRPSVRRASADYLKRLGLRSGFWAVQRHVLRFAQCSLDRLFFLSGTFRQLDIQRHGHEHLEQLKQESRGAILLGAHLGSFEALRTLSREKDIPVHVLAYFDNAVVINDALSRAGTNRGNDFLPLEVGGVSHALRIKELIDAGQIVAILADRAFGPRSAEVEFLGGRARFPLGPFAIAAALECPVLLAVALHTAPNRYDLFCEPLIERVPKRGENPNGLVESAQIFATRLESFCRRAPDNWFNFYDFWPKR